MKVVINACFGGFGLSEEGTRAYWARKGKQVFTSGAAYTQVYYDEPYPPEFALPEGTYFMEPSHPEYDNHRKWCATHTLYDCAIDRNDPDLAAVVEELGNSANGAYASLKVVEIPDDIYWEISEYDGSEHVAEKHRTWY